jgi:antitoxin VapB
MLTEPGRRTAQSGEREVSLFRNGRSQAVRIPKEFEIDADRVVMWKDADGTIHMRAEARKKTLAEAIDWLIEQGPLDEEFPTIEDMPPEEVDLGLEQ